MKHYLFFLPFGSLNYRFIGEISKEEVEIYKLKSITSGTFITGELEFGDDIEDKHSTIYLDNFETITVEKFPEYKIVSYK